MYACMYVQVCVRFCPPARILYMAVTLVPDSIASGFGSVACSDFI